MKNYPFVIIDLDMQLSLMSYLGENIDDARMKLNKNLIEGIYVVTDKKIIREFIEESNESIKEVDILKIKSQRFQRSFDEFKNSIKELERQLEEGGEINEGNSN